MKTEKFLDLCERGEFEIANAYVEELWDSGQDIKAERLRRLFLQVQSGSELDVVFVPFTHEEPPVLEACWFEGTPKEYEEADRERAEETNRQYESLKERIGAEV